MHIRAYIRVHANESTVRAIYEEARLPNASPKQLKAPRDDSGERWWDWQTPTASINIDAFDDGLKSLLLATKPIFPIIQKHRGPETEIYLEVVTRYDEHDNPLGMYLSAETLKLLGELGAALDIDVEDYGLTLRKVN